MLGIFPDPYTDELFYSVLVRLQKALGITYNQMVEALFGIKKIKVNLEFQNKIDLFLSKLPPGSRYTANSIIRDNTLLPYYAPFLPTERVEQTIKYIRGMDSSSLHNALGILSVKIPKTSHMRFCPACLREELVSIGEAYWHRVHQIPGVKVCDKHLFFLENSDLKVNVIRHRCILESPTLDNKSETPIILSDNRHQILH